MHDELTAKDIEKMKEEIAYRIGELRPKLLAEVKRTREYGDLSENYEYKAAKQEKNRNESRIRYLQAMIDTAVIIEKGGDAETVGLFDRVTIYLPAFDKIQTWQITTTLRVDVLAGIISKESPLGQALLGHRVGDVVTVHAQTTYTAEIRNIEKCEDTGELPINRF